MHIEKWGTYPPTYGANFGDRQITQAHSAFARAIKLNHRDSGLCTSFALVCMIMGDITAAITSLHEVQPLDLILF